MTAPSPRALIWHRMRLPILSVVALAALLAGCAGGSWREPAAASPVVAYEPSPGAPPPSPPAAAAPRGALADYGYHFADVPIAAGSISAPQAKQPTKPPVSSTPAKPGPAKGPPPPPVAPPAPDPAAQAPAPHREPLLIYTATLAIAVSQVDVGLTEVEAISAKMGGYLASRNDASIVVRVPRARFQDLLSEVSRLGEVLHRNVQAEDVSDQVVDLEVRLKNARAVRDRLAQLLQGATATKDALEIEKELARVTADIESMEGKLQLFTDRIAYSTVTVTLQATSTVTVRSKARLPFPWLDELGLASLLEVK